ncbi:glutathionylspermidine synthase family protein [Clostridium sp. SHJSY1]|uniref:glutathionylspermidine synthase family protein n=1 Tax=Clostridium sp. SHJSY1 TaxID=2942483 RepID=UPI0028757240|nr:glutathionylspermidine synthase family protein [Clostridium sp. SHJSY1]MDS0528071.1 glutathionylspermidine synthase family protein [Clostridium sp. SHJSY1]
MDKRFINELLFKYHMVHSTRNHDIFTREPFYLENRYYYDFKETGTTLNNLVIRIIEGINDQFKDLVPYMPDFPYKKEILELKNPLAPLLWTRYDGFVRNDGTGVFYSELNYDKPCAQREIMIMESLVNSEDNINNGFLKKLKNNLYSICESYFEDKEKIIIALLCSSSRPEETHVMMLFKSIFENEKFKFIVCNNTNFQYKDDSIHSFGEKIDVVIRLYPTEYLKEVNCFSKMLDLFQKGKLLLLNDPRVIIGQCKNLYTYLWKLVKNNDSRLSNKEMEVIRKSLPYTELLDMNNIKLAIQNKDKWVIKPVYGRYSIDVFIGKLYSDEEWAECVSYAIQCIQNGKYFILQEFCEIREDVIPYFDGAFNYREKAFANLGVFISLKEYIGTCVRINSTYLTEEEETWVTPILKRKEYFKIASTDVDYRSFVGSLLKHGFCGNYSRTSKYINTNPLILDKEKYEELKYLTNRMAEIFKKSQSFVKNNISLYKDVLNLGYLEEIIKNSNTEELCLLGRMDWILENDGTWKVVEINSETPAGTCETAYINEELLKKLDNKLNLININSDFKEKLLKQTNRMIEEYSKVKNIKSVAIVGSLYYEDWYTINTIKNIFKEIENITVTLGNIYDLKVSKDGETTLYGNEVDAIFRYYPLDWLEYEETEDLGRLRIALENNKVISLNNTNSIISQNKIFFALIYELLKFNFFSEEEIKLIEKHIPYTTLEFKEIKTNDFLAKPILSREGKGIVLSRDIKNIEDFEEGYIFQEYIFSQTLNNKYPVFGAYVCGNEFSGLYTRVGSEITDICCMYVPTFVEDK